MITTILFDNNGVLTTNDKENTYKVVAVYLGITIERVIDLFGPHVVDLDKGKITQTEFYERILRDGKFNKSPQEFADIHLNAYKPKLDNQKLASDIKKNYRIALLTNFGDAFWQMFPAWGLDKVFDKEEVFVSSDMGLAKPDPDYFYDVLKKLNIKPAEAVFIDDNKDNIMAAKKLGIKTILFENYEHLVDSLHKLGVQV